MVLPKVTNGISYISFFNLHKTRNGLESFGISLLISLIIPLSCLILAFVFGLKNGMSFVYIFIMLILYIPQVIYYKSPSVAIVGFIYLIFSFIGMYTGANLGKTIKSRGKKDNNN